MRATEHQVEHWVREAVATLREELTRRGFAREDLDPDHVTGMPNS
jgi:hypothetical protein